MMINKDNLQLLIDKMLHMILKIMNLTLREQSAAMTMKKKINVEHLNSNVNKWRLSAFMKKRDIKDLWLRKWHMRKDVKPKMHKSLKDRQKHKQSKREIKLMTNKEGLQSKQHCKSNN
jgi:hypothetical protein